MNITEGTALIGRRPCGCVTTIEEEPWKPGSKTREQMEAKGYTVTEHPQEEAVAMFKAAVLNPDALGVYCSHGTTQRQLAEKVKAQAARIRFPD